MTFIYLALTIFFWGTGQTLLKIGFSKSTPISSFFLGGLAGIFVAAPYIAFYERPIFDNYHLFLPIMLAVALCYLTYYYALNAGELSVASAILGTYPMYTVLFAVIVMKEVLVLKQYMGLFLVIGGVGALSVSSGGADADGVKGQGKSRVWIFLSILSAVLIGVADAVSKVVLDHTNPATYFLYFGVIQITLGFFLKLVFEGGNFDLAALRSKYSIIGMFLLNCGGMAFTFALKSNQASIVVPLSSTYLALVTLLSWWFLKERFTVVKGLGITAIIAGVMLL